jgi:hypothetical protein
MSAKEERLIALSFCRITCRGEELECSLHLDLAIIANVIHQHY